MASFGPYNIILKWEIIIKKTFLIQNLFLLNELNKIILNVFFCVNDVILDFYKGLFSSEILDFFHSKLTNWHQVKLGIGFIERELFHNQNLCFTCKKHIYFDVPDIVIQPRMRINCDSKWEPKQNKNYIFDLPVHLIGHFYKAINYKSIMKHNDCIVASLDDIPDIIKESLIQYFTSGTFDLKYSQCSYFNICSACRKIQGTDNWAALHHWTSEGRIVMINYVLNRFPKHVIDLPCPKGYTILMRAAEYSITDNRIEILKILIKANAKLDLQNNEGFTALMLAAKYSNSTSSIGTVNMLIYYGANIHLQNNEGDTALSLAKKYQNSTSSKLTVELLLSSLTKEEWLPENCEAVSRVELLTSAGAI